MPAPVLSPPHVPLTDPQSGRLTPEGYRFLIEVQRNIDAQIVEIQAALDRIRRLSSHTDPTRILHASDAGSDVTISVDAHTRIFGDATTLAIGAGSVTGLAYSTTYAGYYDDTTLEDGSPTFLFTTTIKDAQAVAADGRFFLGVITTPAASGATVDGGGVYPTGSSVGGEL